MIRFENLLPPELRPTLWNPGAERGLMELAKAAVRRRRERPTTEEEQIRAATAFILDERLGGS